MYDNPSDLVGDLVAYAQRIGVVQAVAHQTVFHSVFADNAGLAVGKHRNVAPEARNFSFALVDKVNSLAVTNYRDIHAALAHHLHRLDIRDGVVGSAAKRTVQPDLIAAFLYRGLAGKYRIRIVLLGYSADHWYTLRRLAVCTVEIPYDHIRGQSCGKRVVKPLVGADYLPLRLLGKAPVRRSADY